MKKILAILLAAILCIGMAACGGSEEETEAEKVTPADCIESIDLETTEDGVAFWTVHLNDKATWDMVDTTFAVEGIRQCVASDENGEDVDYSVQGVMPDESIAYTWGKPNDYEKVYIYDEEQDSYDYGLMPSELEEIGLN